MAEDSDKFQNFYESELSTEISELCNITYGRLLLVLLFPPLALLMRVGGFGSFRRCLAALRTLDETTKHFRARLIFATVLSGAVSLLQLITILIVVTIAGFCVYVVASAVLS